MGNRTISLVTFNDNMDFNRLYNYIKNHIDYGNNMNFNEISDIQKLEKINHYLIKNKDSIILENLQKLISKDPDIQILKNTISKGKLFSSTDIDKLESQLDLLIEHKSSEYKTSLLLKFINIIQLITNRINNLNSILDHKIKS